MEFINWKEKVKSDSVVFIKPNFTYPFYKEGITTNPELLRHFLKLIKTRANRVIVGESDGGNHSFTAEDSFNGHGMYEICKELDVELISLSKSKSRFIEEKIAGKKVKVQVPELLINDIDVFISVPVLKVHAMTNATLSMKNLWGCFPDTMRCLHHKDLDYKLPLLTKLMDIKIILTDALYSLDGHGPMYGTPKKTNMLYSCDNPVAADSLGVHLMGLKLSEVKHVLKAEKAGLGSTDLNNIKMNDDWKKYMVNIRGKKSFSDYLSIPLFKSALLAKIVMDSPFTPLIYKLIPSIRNKDEQMVNRELDQYRNCSK
jgi:uncharacterized protein (DUF362 family)